MRLKQVYARDVLRSYENSTRIKVSLDEMSFQTFTVNLPSDLLANDPGVLNETELRYKFVAYRANPFLGHPDSSLLESPYLNFTVFDAAAEPLNINEPASSGELVDYLLPYSQVKYLDPASLKCKTFTGSTFEDLGCLLRVYTPPTCFNCSGVLNLTAITACLCNHTMQQGIALIYDTPIVVEPLDTLHLAFY